MRLGRGPREVYRVYGEGEAPDVDEWSDEETPTRELAVDGSQPEVSTHEIDTEPPARPSDGPRHTRRSHARVGQLRRVAAMTLLGLGMGLVATLAIHGLRGSAGVNGGRAGKAGQGAASWPSTSSPVPVAAVPPEAHTLRTVRAAPVHVEAVHAPRGHSKKRESPTLHAASAVYVAVYSAAATPSKGTTEVQAPAETAESEFTFER